MKLKKLIKKINKENTPPDGWKAADAVNKEEIFEDEEEKESYLDVFGYE